MPNALMLVAAALVAAVAPLSFAQQAAPVAIAEQYFEYDHDGTTLRGFIAEPANTGEIRATVLIVHAWQGQGDEERERARMLARLGYYTMALDMYGDGLYVATSEEASAQATIYYNDRELMRGRVQAAIDALRADKGFAQAGRTAIIGYCFGGTVALECARAGMEVDAAVSFHGGLSFERAPRPGQVGASVLVCNGNDDPLVSVEDRRTFIDEMEAAGADFQFIEYADAVHSFTSRAAGERREGSPVAYNATADRRSWRAMRGLFEELFGG
ncbi:MAG: dienelactone hydrolase family protein [Planctomycetota bacterium]